jgi:predicted dehydrogenase
MTSRNHQDSDAVGIAVVGCGRAARQHVEAVRLAGAGRIVAVVGGDQGRADDLARVAEASARSLDDVLADTRIDAVAVCTPPDSHVSIATAALRAGKGVIVEKPVARTGDELDAMLAAAEASGAPALAMLQHRGSLPDDALTGPWTAQATATVEVLQPRPRAHYLSNGWRHDPDRSTGGHTAHLAVHYLDLACQLLGAPTRVTGLTDCRDVAGIETRAALAVRFAGGSLMSVLTSAHPAPTSERLHVVDGDRELLVTGEGTEYRVADRAESLPPVPAPELRAAVYQELRAALRGEAAPDRYALRRARGVTALLAEVRRLTLLKEPVS